jgi:hypothetical protein
MRRVLIYENNAGLPAFVKNLSRRSARYLTKQLGCCH